MCLSSFLFLPFSNYFNTVCWKAHPFPHLIAMAPLSNQLPIGCGFFISISIVNISSVGLPYGKAHCIIVDLYWILKSGRASPQVFSSFPNCFGYSRSLVFSYTFYYWVSNFSENFRDFDKDCIVQLHLNNIESFDWIWRMSVSLISFSDCSLLRHRSIIDLCMFILCATNLLNSLEILGDFICYLRFSMNTILSSSTFIFSFPSIPFFWLFYHLF